MCGIAGVLGRPRSTRNPAELATAMAARLIHRGPDDCGSWTDDSAGVALAHRRLSVIDTSIGGHQPMLSPSGRYTIVYNGEVYNFRAIREELARQSVGFRTESDTEVLLAAIETWGLEAALRKMTGMFAFALWDSRERALMLVRDRLGEKPLYFGVLDGYLAFASELKAFRAIPRFDDHIDPLALHLFTRYAYVPAPRTILAAIRKLPPGHTATVRLHDDETLRVHLNAYWRADQHVAERLMSYDDALREAEALLSRAVRSQMVADVPIGAFLSGGVDSSVVVALMQEATSIPVRTFSIGSPESAYDEAQYARAVARHLGTDHTELYVTSADALTVVPELARIYDEPFADSSQIPMVLVSRLARRHVTVALSGDGGDELFGGYNRYSFAPRVWGGARRIPRAVRATLATMMCAVPPAAWDRIESLVARSIGERGVRLLGEKVHKLARALPAAGHEELYRRLASCWVQSPLLGQSEETAAPWFQVPGSLEPVASFSRLMMYLDLVTYLPDDILVKVDRATMSTSLEARVPMLDHRVVEFALSLPLQHKISTSTSKRILRDIEYARVPRTLLDRPKSGLGVPIDGWLRGPLRDWAEALLSRPRLAEQGIFDAEIVRCAWDQHIAGSRPRHHELWAVLMVQAWLDEYTRVSA